MSDVLIGVSDSGQQKFINLSMSNRHGLIAGATGTGKTVTLQRIAEQFSRAGIAVFTADVKGDLSGLAKPGLDNPKIIERLKSLKINETERKACPTLFGYLR